MMNWKVPETADCCLECPLLGDEIDPGIQSVMFDSCSGAKQQHRAALATAEILDR